MQRNNKIVFITGLYQFDAANKKNSVENTEFTFDMIGWHKKELDETK